MRLWPCRMVAVTRASVAGAPVRLLEYADEGGTVQGVLLAVVVAEGTAIREDLMAVALVRVQL